MARKHKNNSARQRRPLFEELEPRVLYSADLAPQADTAPATEHHVIEAEEPQAEETSEYANTYSDEEILYLDSDGNPIPNADTQEDNQRLEVVFVDDSISNVDELLSGIQSDQNTVIQTVLINGEDDGWKQIQQALSTVDNINAIHFLSHGDDATFKLGDTWIDQENLSDFEQEFRALSVSLSADADLLFYGCDISSNDAGKAMMDQISLWSGADVAASEDLTGHSLLGGDWDLEYQAGEIEASLAVSDAAQSNWEGLLATDILTGSWSGSGPSNSSTSTANTVNVTGSWVTPGNTAITGVTTGTMTTNAFFSNSDVQGRSSLQMVVYWDTSAESGNPASNDAGTFTVTFTFDKEVVNPILHVDRIGGVDSGQANGSEWTVTTAGATLTKLAGVGHFEVDSDKFYRTPYDSTSGSNASSSTSSGTAAGSLQVNGSFTSLTFDVTGIGGDGTGGDGIEFVWEVIANAPLITSNGGGSTASVSVVENTTAVTTVAATDAQSEAVTYSISGGTDQALFSIHPTTGVLTFNSAPDYESPTDSNTDNVYQVIVSATDTNGESDTQTINVTVTNTQEAPVGIPAISGTVQEDQTLTANTAGISDSDGLGAFSYQWLRDGVNISGATSSTYTLGDNDVGTQISVQVSYTDGHGTGEGPLTSAQTSVVTNVNDDPTGSVSISGTTTENQTLTASNTLADIDGLGAITYQWKRDGVNIGGATSSTYTLTNTDVGAMITVSASYTDGHGTAESELSSAVGPVAGINDAPVNTVPGTQTIDEDVTTAIAGISISDPDAGSGNLTTRLQVSNGTLNITLSGSASISAGSNGSGDLTIQGTVGDINATLASLTYTGNSNLNGTAADTLTITTNDGGNTGTDPGLTGDGSSEEDSDTITIDLSAVNDDPGNSGSLPSDITVDEDVSSDVDLSSINLTDVDSGSSNLTVTLTTSTGGNLSATSGGGVTVGGSGSGSLTLTGSLADLNTYLDTASNIQYLHGTTHLNGDDADTINVVVNDGGNTGSGGGGNINLGTVNVDINAVNDAPVLDNSGAMSFTSIDENDVTNTGMTVAALIATAGGDRITDVDSSPSEGIAINTVNDSNGTWEFSTNGGGSWSAIGTVTDTSALLLRDTDRVRFVPDTFNGDSATIGFRAWDQSGATAGLQGTKADVSTNGTTTAFSSATETASITVTDVNDAPTITNSGTVTLAGTDEETTSVATFVTPILSSVSWADVDNGAVRGLAIIAMTGNGTWQYSTDGSTWTGFGAVASNNALLLDTSAQVRYIPDGSNGETASFDFHAWDQTADSASVSGAPQYANPSPNGGETAYSSSVATAQLDVAAINDNPVANADTATADEAGGVANATAGVDPTGNVLANDTDLDNGDTKTVVGVAVGTVSSASTDVGTTVTGTYGDVVINSDGSFTYTVDNSNAVVQALRTTSDTITDTFTYTMSDTSGALATTQLVVTIRGANDAPVVVIDTPTATEASGVANATAGVNPSGNVLTNDLDVDNADTKTVTGVAAGTPGSASGNVGVAVSGSYGDLTINTDGSYSYVVDNNNATVEALRTAVDTLTDTFTYTIIDAAGASSSHLVQVTIQGANDAVTSVADTATAVEAGGVSNASAGTDPSGNVLSNDTELDSGDTLTVVGVAAGTLPLTAGSVASGIAGSYGTLTLNADGSYTYVVDNNNAAVEALRTSGDTLDDTFTYTVEDAVGESSTTQLTVTIQGANDTPAAVSNSATAIEDGGELNSISGYDPTGNVLTNDTDSDAADTKTVVGVALGVQASTSGNVGSAIVGTYGTLTINSDGSYSYVLDNANGTVEALNTGDPMLSETFSYTLQDTSGAQSTTQLVISIDGRTDLPFANSDLATSVEAGGIANGAAGTDPTGNVLANDVAPNGEEIIGVAAGTPPSASGSVGISVAGSYGSIVIDTNGDYTYTLDNSNAAVQALRISSDHLTEVFTYTMEDDLFNQSTTTLTITIDGANDTPTAVVDAATAIEANGLNNATAGTDPSGNVLSNDTEVDTGDSLQITGVEAGVQLSASGSVGASVTGSYGAIVIDLNGNYSYTLDNNNAAVQALRHSGETLTDTFTYTTEDLVGATSTNQITITIEGRNDAPIAVLDTATAIETGAVAGSDPSGNVLSNDVEIDTTDTLSVSGVAVGVQVSASGSVGSAVSGSYGDITINSDGTYSYALDNSNAAVQALRTSGETLTDTFTYTMQDIAGVTSTQQIQITIQGANDTPVANDNTDTAVEAGGEGNTTPGTNPSGNLISDDTDADGGDTMTVSGVAPGNLSFASGSVGASVVGSYGSLNVDASGNYSYTVDNSNAAVEALRTSGETLTDVFTYTIEDASGETSSAQITLTIQGVNDNPVAVANNAIAVEAGGLANATAGTDPSGNVMTNDSDVDGGDTQAVTGVAAGAQASASGNVGSGLTGTYGTVTINSDGSYSYVIDNSNAAVQALRLYSDTLTEIFTYTIQDTLGADATNLLTFTLHGSNDTPVANADTATAVEAGGLANGTAGTDPSGNVLSNDTDSDAGDTQTISGVAAGVQVSTSGSVGSSVSGSYGNVTINSDGSYSYVVDNSNAAVQALRTSGETLTDVFSYTMRDTAGDTSTTQLTVTIQGANDTLVAVADTATAVEAGGLANGSAGTDPSGNVLTNDTDVDSGDTQTVVGVEAGVQASASGNIGSSLSGSYGDITLNSDGTYTYVIDNSNAAVQALRTSSDTLTEIFTYTAQDTAGTDSTTQLTITIQGANDTPVAIADTATATEAGGIANATAGTDPSGNVLSNDTDEDSGDSQTVSGVATGIQVSTAGSVGSSLTGTYGSLTLNSDGSYTYVVDNSNAAVQALRTTSDTLNDVFSYTMEDTDGAASTTQLTVTIQGANDNPHSLSLDNTTVNEAAAGIVVGNLSRNDVDSGDSETYSIVSDVSNKFEIVGSQLKLKAGESLDYETATSHNLTLRITDTAGGFFDQAFTINVTDVDEFDTGPVTDTDATANLVTENDSIGTATGITANATDDDGTAVVTYSLDDDAGGRFAIDTNTGVVTVAGAIDREATASYDIIVRATSTDTSFSTETFTINIGDVDEFDVTAPADTDVTVDAVDENAANGTTVGITASAFDSDATTNAVTYSLTDDAGGRFAIDTNSGVVTVADGSLLDREAAASHDITVRATSADGSTDDTTFTIALNDVDEFDVTAPADTDVSVDAVDENAANGTAVGITASASDSDATTNAVTYSLTDDAGGRFAIDTNSGVVTVADGSLLDREAAASHDITIRATSADGSTDDTTFTIALNDVDEFDVTAPADTDVSVDAVNENAANGTAVGVTASASDSDATTNTVTYSLTDDAGGRFTIDTNSGVVTVADGSLLDREAAASHDITVRATSADGSTDDSTFTISLNDVDEFNVTAPADTDVTVDAVDENAVNGTAVGITASASDADATTNAVTYSLTDDAGGRFAIDTNSGAVTVADGSLLDREATASHDITIRATSADGSTDDATFTIALNDVDEFDVTAPADTDVTVDAVDENAANGTTVGITASASDSDATTNTVTYSLTDDAGGRFTIDTNSGVVTVADGSLLDREAAASHDITVRSTSADGSTNDTTFTIALNDVDEFDVTAPADTDVTVDAVDENAANGTSVGITASASDSDATTNAVTYSLTDDAGGRFTIDTNSGVVTVADGSLLDREAAASHDITIRATSADGSIDDTTFTIALNDVDEFDVTVPVDIDGSTNTVAENTLAGTSVGLTLQSSDADATTNAVTYSLSDDAGGRFAIDANTGLVTVNTPLDAETATSHNITAVATSADGSTASQTFSITVTDVDEFDATPITDGDSNINSVAENSPNGTPVNITAISDDFDVDDTVGFTLSDDAGGRFSIHPVTGEVTVSGPLDAETSTSHNIIVVATSTDGSIQSQVYTILVTDVDETDVTPIVDTDANSEAVNENAPVGTQVGITAQADDLDLDDTVSYSLVDDGGGRFTIDALTGVITVALSPDYETAPSHSITVRATSTDGSISEQNYTINIGNLNDNAPVIEDAVAEIPEDAANGDWLIDFHDHHTSNDLDRDGDAISYSIINGNDDGIFSMDMNTGEIVVADASLLDFETTPVYLLEIQASDGSFTDTAQLTLQVENINEAPVNQLPSDVSVDEDTPLAFDGSNSLSIFDVDAHDEMVQVTLTANNGLLSLGSHTDLTLLSGISDVQQVVVQGSQSSINSALQNLVFTPNADFNGDASLTVLTDDLGNTGFGSALRDEDIVPITVIPVNDEGQMDVPVQLEILPGNSLDFSDVLNDFAPVEDIDSVTSDHNLTLNVDNATLEISDPELAQFISLSGDGSMVITGDLETINRAISSLVIIPDVGYWGDLSLEMMLEDVGGAGVGDSRTISSVVNIYIPQPALDAGNDDEGKHRKQSAHESELLDAHIPVPAPWDLTYDYKLGNQISEMDLPIHSNAVGHMPGRPVIWVDLDAQYEYDNLHLSGTAPIQMSAVDWVDWIPDGCDIDGPATNPMHSWLTFTGEIDDHRAISIGNITDLSILSASAVWVMHKHRSISSRLLDLLLAKRRKQDKTSIEAA